MVKFEPEIKNSIQEAINYLLQGKEVVLVKLKKPSNIDLTQPGIVLPLFASDLESQLLENMSELNEFAEICYGKNYGLRPCPIFLSKAHTIITKNIGVNIGLSRTQKFQFQKNSTMDSRIQNLMFKLKPNHHLTEYNHIIFYNRYDGAICLEDTNDIIDYDATEYLLLFAPLLVVHKREDMLECTANICFDSATALLRLGSLREYDFVAAQTGQLSMLTHNGHPNPLFIADSSIVHPSQITLRENQSKFLFRYQTTSSLPGAGTDRMVSGLDGTLFKMYPSYLFRRNWFIALGHKREHGAWIGACYQWLFLSHLSKEVQDYLLRNWVASEYHHLEQDKRTKESIGISKEALNRKQEKFIKLNFELLEQKLQESKTDTKRESVLVQDDFIPSDAWNALLKRRVEKEKQPKTKIVSKKKNHQTKHESKPYSQPKEKKEKSSSRKKHSTFHIIPPEVKSQDQEVENSKLWLQRIHENIKAKKQEEN
jgi:hypothetical protein